MGVIVAFDYTMWSTRYPEFAATVSQPQAQLCFNEAGLYLANDGSGPVNNSAEQSILLNMLTAHIAQNSYGSSLQVNSSIVGRISDATEGTVSVSTDNEYEPGSPQWYQQTKYGSSFWAATVKYRSMLYRRPPLRSFAPYPYGRGYR